jgi:hypothetical protein
MEVITPFTELDRIEDPGGVEGHQRCLILGSEHTAAVNLHIRAAWVSNDGPANGRQVIKHRFVDSARGGTRIKPVTEFLFLHQSDQLAQSIEFSGRSIHGEHKFSLTWQQPRLPEFAGERAWIFEWICRSVDSCTAHYQAKRSGTRPDRT